MKIYDINRSMRPIKELENCVDLLDNLVHIGTLSAKFSIVGFSDIQLEMTHAEVAHIVEIQKEKLQLKLRELGVEL